MMDGFTGDLAQCPKCGNRWIETSYDDGRQGRGGDVLRRHCTCGYSWSEAPLDAAREQAPNPIGKLLEETR